jgi:hypothetical protein
MFGSCRPTFGVSLFSAVIALLSFAMSSWTALRDRYRLDVYGRYLDSYEHLTGGIYLRIANRGRRPVTLRCVALILRCGEQRELPIDPENPRHFPRLIESEIYEVQFTAKNTSVAEILWEQVMRVAVEDFRNKSLLST